MLVSPLLILVLSGCDGEVIVVAGKEDTAEYTGLDDETGDTASAAGPEVEVSPISLDFGIVPVGVATTMTFNIANLGDSPLTVGATVTTGATPFSLNTGGAYILPGTSNDIIVTFVADTVAAYTGAIQITSDDSDEPEVIVGLAGAAGADSDGDGYLDEEDCTPDDAASYPGGTEIWYDGIDGNCDGLSDYDQDGDGYDAAAYGGDDCNDLDAAINSAASEIWYDGIDENCDDRSDYDQDGDGYDASDYFGDDCDDVNAAVSPGTLEVLGNAVDDDCDGNVDEPLATEDLDHDGFAEVDGDCNDGDAAVSPAATEVWYDGLDQNCDGASDYDQDGDTYESSDFGGSDCADTDAAIGPSATQVWYDGIDQDCDGWSDYDQDRDGHDDVAYGGTDCDDLDAVINPDASELWYDGIDQNCDGGSDYDQDADGFDSGSYGGGDCNDLDSAYYPGATEVWYDGMDESCDGGSDYDADGDGYDSSAYGGGDCDDADVSIAPGTTETWYDGVDTNCDGRSDYDADADGFDSSAYAGDDCDDTQAAINPTASEVCDGVDDDCDGVADNGVTTTYYVDTDGDGYGDPRANTEACSVPSGYVGNTGDCNDAVAAAWTGAAESCDAIDNDCDGTVDEGVKTTFYADSDADGYGNLASTTAACSMPSGYAADSTDCNDAASTTYPGATELCDVADNDCDGSIDEGATTAYYADSDGDGYGNASATTLACSAPSGYVSSSTDCNDTTSSISPAATEVCDGIDNDCDGAIDDGTGTTVYYRDADVDGYGDSAVTTTGCSTAPSGYVSVSTDCDDTDATSNPGASELAYDAADNDCDGIQDDMVAETESDWTVLGELASDAVGNWGVHAMEDLDGDGDSELVICAGSADLFYYYYTVSNVGLTSFHDASTAGIGQSLTDGYYEYYGNGSDDYNGSAFAALEDLDGDGYSEVAFAAYQNDATSTDDGTVYILDIQGESGYDGASVSSADGAIYGDSENGNFGYAMASGDFDGDGMSDLATGAPGEQSGRGRVYVTFDGDGLGTAVIDNTDSTFYTTGVSASDHLGYSVGFGDFGNDGYDDLVACSPDDDDVASSAGTCWVINGSATRGSSDVSGTTVSSLDSAVITGSAATDQVGLTPNSLSVGDLNDDGIDDLALGVPGYDGYSSGGGGVWVYTGGNLSGSETYATANYLVRGDGALGTGVNMTGDVTGDGVTDLLAGATTAGGNVGVVYLLEGGLATGTYTFPADQYASWSGKHSGDLFGASISGLQDLDNDGVADFVVAATGNDDGASNAGKVYVLPAY